MKTSRNIGRFLTTVVVVTVLACTANGRTIYVDDDAAGANDGSSWANAYQYLQDALAVAIDGDEIMVAQGTYRPDQGGGQTSGDQTAWFQLISGVTISGGYAGVIATNPDLRDFNLFETVLSGDLSGNDVEVTDPCDLFFEPTRADNSYHIVTGSDCDATALLDGFTITAGKADGDPNTSSIAKVAGGMFTDWGSPTLVNCSFIGNSAGDRGGAMYNQHGVPNLSNCTFSENAAAGFYGGGIYNQACSPIMTDCTFSKNWAEGAGGGMYNTGDWSSNTGRDITLTNCTFIENTAGSGGGMYSQGSHITVNNCDFTNNNSVQYGGAIANHSQTEGTISGCVFTGNISDNGGAVSNNNESNVTFDNCLFSKNSSINYGGGMYNDFDAKAIVTDCTFADNNGGDGGGGIMNTRGGNAMVTNCIFNANWSNNGGGVYNRQTNSKTSLINCVLSSNSSSSSGGGISNHQAIAEAINCTFSDNFAANDSVGGGIFIDESSEMNLVNCILWDNIAIDGDNVELAQIYADTNAGGISVLNYSCIQGWTGDLGGTGNIGDDPMFVDDANDDYHLLEESPCVNTGDNSSVPEWIETDLKGRPRIIDDIVDIGAYEFTKAVYFADPNLQVAVEERLGVINPTENDMLALDFISPVDLGITDLMGLEYATNMTVLELYQNEITDVSPLSGLTNLTVLNLQLNQIDDISPLKDLTNLENLDIQGNQIIDISAVSEMSSLSSLRLNSNHIVDLTPLSQLTNLQRLRLGGNQINDISPLSNLTNLDELGIGNNKISSIDSISNMTNMNHLAIQQNQINDISILSQMTGLTFLDSGNNQLSDVSALSDLSNLTWLSLANNNQISDISPLSNLFALEALHINGNQIVNISPLLGMTNLTLLNLGGNPLDEDSYCSYLQTILDNNPNLTLENLWPNPRNAHHPIPSDGEEVLDTNVTLAWTASPDASLHGIYLGENFDDVNEGTGGTFYGDQTITEFTVGLPGFAYPDGLVSGMTYYWRIVEIDADGAVLCNGQVWSFTVTEAEITVEYQVSANQDDGYATNSQLQNLSNANLKVGNSSFDQLPYYSSGMIFRNVNLPQGVEIVSAKLKVQSFNSRLSDVVYGIIQAEAADDALGFGAFRNIGTLPKTSSSVEWDLTESWSPDTWYTSPDISGVIQEVIDRGSWLEGNSLTVIYGTRQLEGGYRNISSFDRGNDSAPMLEITYIPR